MERHGICRFHNFRKRRRRKQSGREKATWGELYVASMRSEASQLQNTLLLTESIQKPNYIDGTQQYGSKEGLDDTLDPLLPIIHEVFGDEANRF